MSAIRFDKYVLADVAEFTNYGSLKQVEAAYKDTSALTYRLGKLFLVIRKDEDGIRQILIYREDEEAAK